MVISQPPDINVTVPNGSFVFRWNPRFGAVMTDRLQKTQRYIDSESIRLMVPYTPMRNGPLMESVKLGTVIGSGELRYIIPYGRLCILRRSLRPEYPDLRGRAACRLFQPEGKEEAPDRQSADLRHLAAPTGRQKMV